MAGMGNTQIINGKSYTMYTPEWYAARDAGQVHESTVAGQAAGAGRKSEYETMFPGSLLTPPTPPQPAAGASPADLMEANRRAQEATQPSVSPAARSLASGTSGGGNTSSSGNSGVSTGVAGAWDANQLPRSLINELVTASQQAPTQAAFSTSAPATISHADTSGTEAAARAATFARTKDNAATTASASLNGLTEALGSRGLTGGGYEAGQIGNTLAREANTIGEGDRQQAESENTRAADLADKDYAGKVAQRGQDLSAQNAQNQLQMQQAQLQVQQRQAALSGLTAALSASTRGVY